MAEEEPGPSEDPGLAPEPIRELSSIGAEEPVERIALCPYCHEEVNGDGYWVIESQEDGFYTGYCNEFHHDIHHRVGLWAEKELPPPLPLE